VERRELAAGRNAFKLWGLGISGRCVSITGRPPERKLAHALTSIRNQDGDLLTPFGVSISSRTNQHLRVLSEQLKFAFVRLACNVPLKHGPIPVKSDATVPYRPNRRDLYLLGIWSTGERIIVVRLLVLFSSEICNWR
jgi:hypothetical protein